MAETRRVLSLDLLRGVAVAGMIVVNSPGDWAAMYAPLRHAEWHGWTPTDLVFPAFLCSVGFALGLSFPRRLETADERSRYWRRIGRRVAALILLGLALEVTYTLSIGLGAPSPGKPGLANLRLPGVLQRIALCYGLAAALLAIGARRQSDGSRAIAPGVVGSAIAILLAGYWALMMLVPVPGFGIGRLDPAGNLAAFLDREIFTVPHLWPLGWAEPGGPAVYDPEGLLSSLPATANVLFGTLAAVAWRQANRPALVVSLAGAALIAAGLALDPAVPINKRIWTPSFALLSSGCAGVAIVTLDLLARSRLALTAMAPVRVLGGNAILAFVLSTLIGRVYGFPLIGAQRVSPQAWLDAGVLRVVGDPTLASLLCSLLVLAIVVVALWPLHRRALHFRL